MSKQPTILICDDEVHILHVVGLKLRSAGYHVLTSTNGVEGLRLALQHRPQLIMTDYRMPGMNGLELCHMLRDHPETAHAVLVLLTARGANLPDDELEQLKLSAIFSKPFSPREVVAHVQAKVGVCGHPASGVDR